MEKSLINLISNFKVEKYNLAFYPSESLFSFASTNNPEAARIACIAELFARWFLNRSGELAEMIDNLLPSGERTALGNLLDEDFLHNPSEEVLMRKFWNVDNLFSQKCLPATRQKLLEICCKTDGFIPVYIKNQAFFVPFHLEDGGLEIRDLSGTLLANWQPNYQRLIPENHSYTCIVHCCQQDLPVFIGSSFMLPVLLAYWRKQGLIKYNHLRLLATGAIEEDRIKAVATAEKTAAVQNCFPQAYLLFPESIRYCSDKPWEVPLASGMTSNALLHKLPEIIESKGLFIPTLRDALIRLPMLSAIREETYNSWDAYYERIALYSKSLNSLLNPVEYMLCLMLKSSALCHMGRTDEALQLNRKAQQFAGKNNMEKSLRRMEIEELVELQDKELFPEIQVLAETLQKNIEQLDDPDLLMRYYGTMGQAHCYGYLAGIAGFNCDCALNYFEKAVLYAQKNNSAGDVAQDLNYRYLWYALFEPESNEAEECFSEAYSYIICNLQDNRNIQTKNKNFLFRFKAFAMYRHLLTKQSIKTENFSKYQLPDDAYPWLKGTVCKYLGALYAAQGKITEAERMFAESIRNLSWHDSIIQFIKMTAYAEAYRSLGKDDDRQQALQLAVDLLKTYPSAEYWISFLLGKDEFPGLKYWY